MDEWTLNDLLECSVCLERLDTSSKVLPCQHTFCKKCLEEIVSTHKELRCPECRILVDAQIEELPPNVLLMRILEGMKNSGNAVPKKKLNTFQKLQGLTSQGSANSVYNNIENTKPQANTRQSPLPTQPFARAVYDYISKEAGDLTFRKGEIILLQKKIDNQWYQGECGGKTGIFPSSYVQVIIPLPNQIATCRALYDFQMVNDEDDGCLAFRKDEIITVIRRVDENWAEGKLNDQIGIFPLAFVEMNNIAQGLMKLSICSQPGPSRIAPPTPVTEDSAPLIPTGQTAVISNSHNLQSCNQNNIGNVSHPNSLSKTVAVTTTKSSNESTGSTVSSSISTPSSSSITPNSSSNTSSTSNSAPNSPPSNQSTHNPNPFLPAPQTPRQMILHTSHITNSPQEALPTSHIVGQTSSVAAEQPFADTHCLWIPSQTGDVSNFYQHPKEKRHSFSAISSNHQTCPNRPIGTVQGQPRGTPTREIDVPSPLQKSVHSQKPVKMSQIYGRQLVPPELPPRSSSPSTRLQRIPGQTSTSWHAHSGDTSRMQKNVTESGSLQTSPSSGLPDGRTTASVSPLPVLSNSTSMPSKSVEKGRDKKEKSGLIKRLTTIKRSKSPPSSTSSYSMDNPVFDDAPGAPQVQSHPIHLRSGSCPSQLINVKQDIVSTNHRAISATTSARLKPRERPSISNVNFTHFVSRPVESSTLAKVVSSSSSNHRKSNSLDAADKKPRQLVPPVRERFRCIVPYPPNSEYELELKVGDIIYVHKKREDGWYKGTQQRTGRTGLFPASFVETY